MAKIFVLPEHIASQIAAGEVVERPASVVKELLENSIDAGATQIEVAVASECRDIRVADNGCGMEPDDAVLALNRHATSKISSAEELWSLRSMGFRGEALPSIASVARVIIYTRTAEVEIGTKVESADGKVSATQAGCAPGTVIEVTDLFYNVPARLKFLKKPATEFAHIFETVQALAVSFPKIIFQLLHEGEVVLRTSGSGKLAQAIEEVKFLSGREQLAQVTYADVHSGMAIYGYVARPPCFRGDRKGILSIVNNRPVRCPLTYKALEHAYSDLLPRGKYPIAVLTVTMNPAQVDVNVHPTKREIKYSNGNDVYLSLARAVTDALALTAAPILDDRGSPLTGATTRAAKYTASPEHAGSSAGTQPPLVAEPSLSRVDALKRPTSEQLRFADRLAYVPPAARVSTAGATTTVPARARTAATLPAGWRLLGYLHNTYFLVETPEGLEIIEQHIAHERVIYERIRALQATPGRLSENAQRLVISAALKLTPEQRTVFEDGLPALRALGFDFDFPGQSGVVLTQVPLELAHQDYAAVVERIVEDLLTADHAEMNLDATKSVACQAAVKNGMPLAEADIIQLLAEWLKTPRNDTCPHGRPIRVSFSLDRLFQLFHPA